MNLKVNGDVYNLEICGYGEPLLLLHGFTGNAGTWKPFCEILGQHSLMICPDLPGHGKTDFNGGHERFSIESTVHGLKGIIDELKIGKVNLLGYSMGGRLALAFALTYPGRVGKLILESSSPGLANEKERQVRRMKDSELANFILEEGTEAFVDYWENIPLFKSIQAMPDKVTDAIRTQRMENSPEGLAKSLIGMGTGAQPSYWDRLPELEADVLLLAGEFDEKFCGIAEKMGALINSASVVIVEDTGHAVHVENPEKFGTIVSGFLTNT
ncbi:2-succinyl-6-hydroxy-2,4-cyclohexadiene-1-carboxylate synthase [Bacillus sp. FJAT-27445]|uniref:2-succinyl-6-hydroxy-2, 4-cyclohexadiene-1-carboxylate synthase n=1 Tax=Bacillus sp. FJAT-27445 TaxID=1679166 RepID=UPI000A7C582C|nr:2-succinyl-6-hydroxy-2,4-cyclohexadiene-1-carboxylate synthase [Bacillus sp. FJAT-27445]